MTVGMQLLWFKMYFSISLWHLRDCTRFDNCCAVFFIMHGISGREGEEQWRSRWSQRGMIIVAYSSRVSALLRRKTLVVPFSSMPPRKARSVVSMRRDAGPKRTGSPSERVIKLGAMRAFSETSRWNANTRVGLGWGEEGCVPPEGKEESRAPEFVRIPHRLRWQDAFYGMYGVMHRPAYEDRPGYLRVTACEA